MKKLLIVLIAFFTVGQLAHAQIEVATVSTFTPIYADNGTGADRDLSTWKPILPIGYSSLGHVAKNGYGAPTSTVFVVKMSGDETSLAYPTDYKLIWADHGSGGDQDGAFWEPVAPEGYVALGTVATNNYSKPSLQEIVCVRKDLVIPVSVGALIWTDAGSGADSDVALWSFQSSSSSLIFSGSFCGFNSYAKPATSAVAYAIKLD